MLAKDLVQLARIALNGLSEVHFSPSPEHKRAVFAGLFAQLMSFREMELENSGDLAFVIKADKIWPDTDLDSTNLY